MEQELQCPFLAIRSSSEDPVRTSALPPKADDSIGSTGQRTSNVGLAPESGRFGQVVRMTANDPKTTSSASPRSGGTWTPAHLKFVLYEHPETQCGHGDEY